LKVELEKGGQDPKKNEEARSKMGWLLLLDIKKGRKQQKEARVCRFV
jgi:hypothetical protein